MLALLHSTRPIRSTPVRHHTQQILLPLESPDDYAGHHRSWGLLPRLLYASGWLVDPMLERLFPWHQELRETRAGVAVAMRVHCVRLGDVLLVLWEQKRLPSLV